MLDSEKELELASSQLLPKNHSDESMVRFESNPSQNEAVVDLITCREPEIAQKDQYAIILELDMVSLFRFN